MLQPFAAGATIVVMRRRKLKIDETIVAKLQFLHLSLFLCIWDQQALNLLLQNGHINMSGKGGKMAAAQAYFIGQRR